MPKEDKSKKVLHEISGKLVYQSMDEITVKFYMEDKGQMGNRNIDFPARLIPENFDPTIHEIVGEYSVAFRMVDLDDE